MERNDSCFFLKDILTLGLCIFGGNENLVYLTSVKSYLNQGMVS